MGRKKRQPPSVAKRSPFAEYRALVPEAKRETMAKLLDQPVDTYDKLCATTTGLAREMIAGNLPADVGKAAIEALKLNAGMVATRERAQQLEHQGGEGLVVALFATRGQRQIEAHYTEPPAEFRVIDVEEEPDREVG